VRRSFLSAFFGVLLCLIYGILTAGQVLGFLKAYRAVLVIPLTLLITAGVCVLYFRRGRNFTTSLEKPTERWHNRWLTTACLLSGLALFGLLVLYPLAHWPYSPISNQLPWDAGLYHFPKAAEMIVTGSAWDLSIAYGEYPFGYESLVALALSLNHAGLLLGGTHALIALFLFTTMLMLAARDTKLPLAAVAFLLSLLLLGYQLARNFDSNLWWIFWLQITLVGKNDLFLAAALLAVLVFIPRSRQEPIFLPGLAMASSIALGIKPNAALLVLVAWLRVLVVLWRSKQIRRSVGLLILSGVLMLPGVLWIVRNLVAQGTVFSPEALAISDWSIASNLVNPFFYQNIPQHLYYILGIIMFAGLVSIYKRLLRLPVLVIVILLVSFAVTPASAFFGTTQERAQLEWRFALPLLAYLFILLLALIEPLVLPVYGWIARRRLFALPLALLVLAAAGWTVWTQRDLLGTYPENAVVLHDDNPSPVGVDGYTSAYDYVQRNISHSVVTVENGLPYYLYDPAFTNSVTRSRPADIVVYMQTSSVEETGYPASLDEPAWQDAWQLVYEDPQGRVYRRR
jgi:hypothetical protein